MPVLVRLPAQPSAAAVRHRAYYVSDVYVFESYPVRGCLKDLFSFWPPPLVEAVSGVVNGCCLRWVMTF